MECMKLTPRKALANPLAKFKRREYVRWVAQDETEGTGEYDWRMRNGDGRADVIDDEEFQRTLALTRPRRRKKAKK